RYLPNHVGRCDRESKCAYQYTWKQYLGDNPDRRSGEYEANTRAITRRRSKSESKNKISSRDDSERRSSVSRRDYLKMDHLIATLGDYDQNTFVTFLLDLFPDDPEDVFHALKDYLIGTKDGFPVFPTINRFGKICKAKLMKFDPATGKRIKDGFSISSLQSKLKRAGALKPN